MRYLLLRLMRWRDGSTSLLRDAARTLRTQRLLLQSTEESVKYWQIQALRSWQEMRDLAIAFRIAQEKPEVDLREDLDNLVRDLSDQVALLEEQIVPK